jgi:hypothetical protein
MKVVVLANMRWLCHSPALYALHCPVAAYPIYLGYNGAEWFLDGNGYRFKVPNKETGAMLLAKQLNAQGAGNG